MIYACLLFGTMHASDIRKISMKDIRDKNIIDKIPLYQKAWQSGIKLGKPFTIQSDQEFNDIVNETVILAAQQSYWPLRAQTIFKDSAYQNGPALFTFFQELRNAQLLPEKENEILDFHQVHYNTYRHNLSSDKSIK
jgi:hypothetical protein